MYRNIFRNVTKDEMKEMNVMISTSNLRRVFQTKKRTRLLRSKKQTVTALEDINFEIHKGEMFGLLGPNGAGKTTTTKILCTLLYPTTGTATVAGYDVVKDAHKVRPLVNMAAGGERMLYFRLTGRENLRYFADLYDLPKVGLKDNIDELLGNVGLLERGDSPVEQYSKGMRQRLQIARALLNDPIVLFLDEPTLGLDVHVARELRELVRQKVIHEKMTVLLTTHYLHEADELCDRIGIIDQGRILTIETPVNLKTKFQVNPKIQVMVQGVKRSQLQEIETFPGVQSIEFNVNPNYRASSKPIWDVLYETTTEDQISSILRYLLEKPNVQIFEAKRHRPSLEDVFIQIIDQSG
ncbi:MAG: ABC transporter ATP-binding protein [Candidatus Hodarchaeota archaeon]